MVGATVRVKDSNQSVVRCLVTKGDGHARGLVEDVPSKGEEGPVLPAMC